MAVQSSSRAQHSAPTSCVCVQKGLLVLSGLSWHDSLFWPRPAANTGTSNSSSVYSIVVSACAARRVMPVCTYIDMADCMAEMIVTYMCTSLVQGRLNKRNNFGSVTKSDVTDYPALAVGYNRNCNCGGTERGPRSPEHRKSKLTAPSSLCSGSGPNHDSRFLLLDTRTLILHLHHRAIKCATHPQPLCAVCPSVSNYVVCYFVLPDSLTLALHSD